jgi:predicted regulator of Ras-like GTPase activity (Roadblock/LC7/MglB family)
MLGFLKKMLRNPQRAAEETSGAPVPPAVAETAQNFDPAPSARVPQLRKNQSGQNARGMELPLQNILASLPLELQPRVRLSDVGDLSITVPLEKILAQLSRGAVRISFGELRQAVPEVFTTENDRDRVLVALPLNDILSRLNPNLIARRRVQRQVQVPTEIASPFQDGAQGLIFSVGPGKPEKPAEPSVAPSRQTSVAAPPVAAPPARSTLTSAPKPAPPTLTPAPAQARKSAPAPSTVAPAPEPIKMTPAPAAVKPVAAPKPKPAVAPSPVSPISPIAPVAPSPAVPTARAAAPAPKNLAAPAPASIPLAPKAEPAVHTPIAPAPAAEAKPQAVAAHPPAPQPAKPSAPEEQLLIALTSIADGWPEVIRKEIVDLKLVDAKVGLPLSGVEQSLKQGRIAFSWKMIRAWITPPIMPAVSAHDTLVLELPLKVVAPQFLARQKQAGKSQQKVKVDEDIPNLFFGFPQPETGAIPVAQATAKPADTNFYVWGDTDDRAKVDESDVKHGASPGTKFVAKYATPNEVVSRAAALEGVAGALIALPDGLMVANRLPPDVNAETIAAFLPQIFGKVSQCTKELRMGDLNNLNFTVGNVPWKIFRVNAIFFAAFGRAGEPLPTAQLAALAAELDHKPR